MSKSPKKRGPKPGAKNAGRPNVKGETFPLGIRAPASVEPHLAIGVAKHGSITDAVVAAIIGQFPLQDVADGCGDTSD